MLLNAFQLDTSEMQPVRRNSKSLNSRLCRQIEEVEDRRFPGIGPIIDAVPACAALVEQHAYRRGCAAKNIVATANPNRVACRCRLLTSRDAGKWQCLRAWICIQPIRGHKVFCRRSHRRRCQQTRGHEQRMTGQPTLVEMD